MLCPPSSGGHFLESLAVCCGGGALLCLCHSSAARGGVAVPCGGDQRWFPSKRALWSGESSEGTTMAMSGCRRTVENVWVQRTPEPHGPTPPPGERLFPEIFFPCFWCISPVMRGSERHGSAVMRSSVLFILPLCISAFAPPRIPSTRPSIGSRWRGPAVAKGEASHAPNLSLLGGGRRLMLPAQGENHLQQCKTSHLCIPRSCWARRSLDNVAGDARGATTAPFMMRKAVALSRALVH